MAFTLRMDTIKAILYEFLPFTSKDIQYYSRKARSLSKELRVLFSTATLPSVASLKVLSLGSALKLAAWFLIWRAFVYAEFGSLWVVMTAIALIFLNLGERDPSEQSAYSVFNKGQWRMPGTLTADDFEREIMHNNNNIN